MNRMSPFVASGGSVIQNLALTSVALFSLTPSCPTMALPLLAAPADADSIGGLAPFLPSLAAGVPHFSTGEREMGGGGAGGRGGG